ncbi:MAG: family 78 glycoside hydrolase catalytic domain [Phenylobacterium sp.]|nr:family 78 glycoside hydrolase catalytic domain [Phenylobacterium sp.]
MTRIREPSAVTLDISRRKLLGAVGATAAASAPLAATARDRSEIRIVGLRTDYVERPLGVETAQPLLSWRLESSRRGAAQSAYQIQVASSSNALEAGVADLWDSGRVSSAESVAIAYGGSPLASRDACHWRVRIWDEAGAVIPYSAGSCWEMGLLDAGDWGAARWLAAEDAELRDDRLAGFDWVTGAPTSEGAPARYRMRLSLDQPGEATILLATYADAQCWVDGAPVPVPTSAGANGPRPAAKLVVALSAGSHVIAVAVGTPAPFMAKLLGAEASALACFIKVRLADGGVMRLGQAQWKSSAEAAADWNMPEHDDRRWSPAAPVAAPRSHPWPPQPAILMRRRFRARSRVARARLYVTALGAYEPYLNGKPADDAVLAPESTDFRKRANYRVIDVTDRIREGDNVIGAMVGDGWYASYSVFAGRYPWAAHPRSLILQLDLTYADGSREVVASDGEWRGARSPIIASEIYDGETYDARLAQPGWSTPGFDDAHWWRIAETPSPGIALSAQVSPPIRRRQVLSPRVVSRPEPGVHVFDFGQNFAGWCRLRVNGARGEKVELAFAELLGPDGLVDRSSLRVAKATDTYILRGDGGEEVFEPHFTYHGFRYVQVTGFPGTPDLRDLEGVVVHSDLAFTGGLAIEQPDIERLQRSILWTQRSNFMGIPTDCPQRSERLGWLGDANMFWDTAAFNMDVAAFTRRFMTDIRDGQAAGGAFPDFAPAARLPPSAPASAGRAETGNGAQSSTPGWGDGGVTLPWVAWRHYGDTGVIEANWTAMARFCEAIGRDNSDFVWRNGRGRDLGDWLSVDSDNDNPGKPTTPKDLVATALWAAAAGRMGEMADATGREAEAAHYRDLRSEIVAAFRRNFVQDNGVIGNGSQTGYVLSLFHQLIPDELRAAAARNLADDIVRRGGALSTGVMGTSQSLEVLADTGYAEQAYSLLLRKDYPSWGYMAAQGATAIWEAWNSDNRPRSSSRNHYALASVGGFLFRRVAGIAPLEPGFRRVRICPLIDPRVRRGGGYYDSVRGRISTDWRQRPDGRLSLGVTIPPNVSARLCMPVKSGAVAREIGASVFARARSIGREDDHWIFELRSGRYLFEAD